MQMVWGFHWWKTMHHTCDEMKTWLPSWLSGHLANWWQPLTLLNAYYIIAVVSLDHLIKLFTGCGIEILYCLHKKQNIPPPPWWVEPDFMQVFRFLWNNQHKSVLSRPQLRLFVSWQVLIRVSYILVEVLHNDVFWKGTCFLTSFIVRAVSPSDLSTFRITSFGFNIVILPSLGYWGNQQFMCNLTLKHLYLLCTDISCYLEASSV